MIMTLLLTLGLPALGSAIAAAVLGPRPAAALAGRAGKGAWGFLKSLTPRSWLVIGGIVLLVVGFIWHQRHAAAQIQAAYDKGADDTDARLAAKALQIQLQVEQLSAKITLALRNQNHEENRRIIAGVDAWRLRGPGKASCTAVAGISALSGGPDQAGGAANAALGRMPYPEWSQLIAMPVAGTAKFVEQHDLNRAEVLNCRAAWGQLTAAWEGVRAELAADADPNKGKRP